MGLGFGLAVAIAAVAVVATIWLFKKLEASPALLGITTPGNRRLALVQAGAPAPGAYELGEYLLLIFCVAMGSLADLRMLSGGSVMLFLYRVGGDGAGHRAARTASALLRIDADSTLICSTATIYGPAQIGPVAAALKNRALVGPGLTLGLAGIALGNYLGLLTAWGLRWLAGGS